MLDCGSNLGGITWLHVSDWHQKGKEFDRTVVRDQMMNDIRKRAEIDSRLDHIDLIVFSGDVAYSGRQDEYEAAIANFFTPLLDATGLGDKGRERLLVVPGNHDVNRDSFDVFPSDILDKLDSASAVSAWLTDDRRRGAILGPLAEYSKFVSNYLGGFQVFRGYDIGYWYIQRFTCSEKSISVACLNSAWLSGHNKDAKGKINDYGHLIVGEPQVHNGVAQLADADVRIAILHHPFDWLNEFDRNRVEERLLKTCHFILCGHQHVPQVKVVKGPDGECVIIPAGAAYDRRNPLEPRYANSYNFVHLDFKKRNGTIYFRRWSDRKTEWLADTDVSKEGQYQFRLPGILGESAAVADSDLKPGNGKVNSSSPSPFEEFEQNVRGWLSVCGHQVGSHNQSKEASFEFTSDEPVTGGYDRIFVFGVEGEANASDVRKLRDAVEQHKTHRGWLISMRRVTPLARAEADKDGRLRCYTLDELLDQRADFSKYFDWLEREIQSRKIDRWYVDLGCTKDDIDPDTGERLGTSSYDRVD
jgi:predicted phosphodiesterase